MAEKWQRLQMPGDADPILPKIRTVSVEDTSNADQQQRELEIDEAE